MAVNYSSGFGRMYDKDTKNVVAELKYQLVETDATKYSAKKWWGEFSTSQKMKKSDNYIIMFEDARRGGCWVSPNSERYMGRSSGVQYYRFFGRGKLGKHISVGD